MTTSASPINSSSQGNGDELLATLARLKTARQAIVQEIKKVVIGQDEAIDQVLAGLFAGGHCMLEGPPGTAKTILISTLARALELDFKRIQFAPDLMPSDITGSEILEEDRTTGRRFTKFVKGPVFTNLLMADEINRTPPKTQAALLEVMQEKQVSVGGETKPLPAPFYVLATQNTMEQEGTYSLPEAQQDRFMLSITMTYLPDDQEAAVVRQSTGAGKVAIRPVIGPAELLEFVRAVRRVTLPRELGSYIVKLVATSRPSTMYTGSAAPDFVKEYVAWGAGTRASQNIALASKSLAAQDGRVTVAQGDIRKALMPVLRHRIGLSFRAEVDHVKVESLIARIVDTVPSPNH